MNGTPVHDTPLICIKTGGRAMEDPDVAAQFSAELQSLATDIRFVVVHGGGAAVTRISTRFGLETRFRDGIRLTSAQEMEVVDMVLAGAVNTALVRSIGRRAVGLSGCDAGLFTGERISPDSHTGRVVATDTAIVESLTREGWVPVISSVSTTSDGTALNINADEAALAIARNVPAAKLIFMSDIPGILKNDEVIRRMTPSDTEAAIDQGVITGGMIPKVRASAGALEAGVGMVAIGRYQRTGDLASFIAGERGTSIVSSAAE